VVDDDPQLARRTGVEAFAQIAVGAFAQFGPLFDGRADPAAQPLRGERRLVGAEPPGSCTRTRVCAATSPRPLTTLDTVATETPAAWAMSANVVRLAFGRIGSSQLQVHRCGYPPVGRATRADPVNRTGAGPSPPSLRQPVSKDFRNPRRRTRKLLKPSNCKDSARETASLHTY